MSQNTGSNATSVGCALIVAGLALTMLVPIVLLVLLVIFF